MNWTVGLLFLCGLFILPRILLPSIPHNFESRLNTRVKGFLGIIECIDVLVTATVANILRKREREREKESFPGGYAFVAASFSLNLFSQEN